MASFGFSVSDVVLISNFAYNVYRSSKRAGGDFRAISIDVKSLRSHLETLNTEFVNPKSLVHRSSTKQKRELGDLLLACKDDLYDLDDELSKYKSLKTKNPRIRDRITFSTNKQASIRANIATHSERLSRVLDGLHISALGRIESQVESQMWAFHEIKSKLDALYEDNRFGRRDPSMVASTDDWIKQELVDDNITEADVELNREYIAACLERIRAHGHAAGKLQGPAESREQLDNGHVKKPDLALGPERSSVEVAIAGAVRPLQPSRPPSLDVASNQRCTPSGSHLNARPLSHRPVLQSPTSGTMIPSVEGHTDRRDSGIAFNDAVLEHAFNSDKEQDANTATQSYDDSAVDALQVSSVETMAEAVHFELDLSTITAEEYARFIMSDKHLVAGGLRQVPTLLPPVSSSRKLQFRLAARLARTINDVKTVSVVAFVPLPLTPEEISAGALKRVSVERLARDSLDPKSKYTKKAQIVEIRTERGHTSCSDSSFDNLGNETLIGPLTVVFKVVKKPNSEILRSPSLETNRTTWHPLTITLQEALYGWERTISRPKGTELRVSSNGPTNPMQCYSVKLRNEVGYLALCVRVTYPPGLTREQQRNLDIVLCQTDDKLGEFQIYAVIGGHKEADEAKMASFPMDDLSVGEKIANSNSQVGRSI